MRKALHVVLFAGLAACGATGLRDGIGPGDCPPHATARRGRCECDAGIVLAGACVPRTVADRLCDGEFDGAACVPARCDAEAVPLSRAICVPIAGLRSSASHPWVAAETGETLGCPAGSVVRARPSATRPALLCLPESSCLPGESWSGAKCVRDEPCPPGSVYDARRASCASVVTRQDRGGRVDLAAWVGATIGADGGAGSNLFCGPLRQNPQALGLLDRPVVSELAVTITAPGNDLTRAEIRVEASPVEVGPAATEVSGILVESLRSLGGAASATRARAVVRCTIGGAIPPETVAARTKL